MRSNQPVQRLGLALVLGSILVQTTGCGDSERQSPQLAEWYSQLADDGGSVDGGNSVDGGIDAGPPPDAGTDAGITDGGEDAGTDGGIPDGGELGCSVIQTPPLQLIQNTAAGFGLHRIDWTAKTSPTHRINSPTPCDREWQVPWPRFDPRPPAQALWTVFTAATPGLRDEASLNFPSFARGVVHLVGDYTVFPKRPEDNGRTIVCTAEFDLEGNQAVVSRLPFGAASSRLAVRLVVTPFPGIIPWDYDNTETCTSAQIGPVQIPECEKGRPVIPPSLEVHAGPVPGTIRLGKTYQVDFFFLAEVARFGDAATNASARTLDFRIHCPDP
jgi:hypothetical protein